MHTDTACLAMFRSPINCGLGSQGGATGRLLKYNPKDGSTAIVAGNMWFPNGVALSQDLLFVAVAETTSMRVRRVYVAGPKVWIPRCCRHASNFIAQPGFTASVCIVQRTCTLRLASQSCRLALWTP